MDCDSAPVVQRATTLYRNSYQRLRPSIRALNKTPNTIIITLLSGLTSASSAPNEVMTVKEPLNRHC
jgi:hypothetical protein